VNRARLSVTAVLLIFLFSSCGPKSASSPVPASTQVPAPTATSIPHAAEIRFALVGNVTPTNVWALFDAKGYSYNNYALISGYWPRLYQLSIPDRNFEAMAASGMPSLFQQEGNFYTATVPLRSDLKWTDGTPFTADDVAFTVNTILSFQLGFDWHDFYNPDFIDHVEAVDPHTVKFYFKQQPNVSVWQYGALQGPIVQTAYWETRVSASAELLPPDDLLPQITSLTAHVAEIQSKINNINASIAILATNNSGYIQGLADIKGLQANLNQTNTALTKAQSQYDSAMDAARQSLYALDNIDEPTLGDWIPAGQENGAWVNNVNPAHPFNVPHFDSVSYQGFADEASAVKALQAGEVDSILASDGISFDAASKISASEPAANPLVLVQANTNPNLLFLVFNDANPNVADPALHTALACIFDNNALLSPTLLNYGRFPHSFVLPDEKTWYGNAGARPCAGLNNENDRLNKSVGLLKSAGYTWDLEPQAGSNGTGMKMPDAKLFPSIDLLVSSSSSVSVELANLIQQKVERLGITVNVESVNGQDVNFAVFSSHQYDMALLGWRVSEYPGYLCDWFTDGNPFGYHSDRIQSACAALYSTSDLATAQKDVYEIQSILAQDLPFIPLYSGIIYDAYQNIKYPFDNVLDGLSGIYGAPSLAIPAP